MKEEIAEAKRVAKHEREREQNDLPEFDEELHGVEEGHGRNDRRETREIKEEFERADPDDPDEEN